MERRESTIWLGLVATCLLAAFGSSCGTGIRDGKGEVYATKTFDVTGGRMQLDGAILDIWPGSVAGLSPITMRRYEEVAPRGAVGPVFEIELPSWNTVQNNDPRIGIDTTADIRTATWARIGYLSPMASGLDIWVPDSTESTSAGCPDLAVCGPVQLASFQYPGGASLNLSPSKVLRLAIVRTCGTRADCGPNQTCQGGACQQCLSPSDCNP